MAHVLRMPGVAADTADAVLAEWLVEESGEFAAADPLATIETEKAAVDLEAEVAGRVLKTLVPPGAQVGVGDPIAVLGDPGEQVDDLDALLESLGVTMATDVTIPERRDVPSDPGSAAPLTEEVETPAPPDPGSVDTATGRKFASPLARRLAKDGGLALADIAGTGPRGRILRRDVDTALADRGPKGAPAPAASAPETSRRAVVTAAARTAPRASAAYEDIPHSRIRRATARRLVQSMQTAPHFYVRATVRAEGLLALRSEINEDIETRISVNDLVVKAVAAAHHRVPEMNATWTDDAVRRYATVDVAVAVATERGLMTPVVRDVGSRTVSALAVEVRDLADRARTGRVTQDELEGGSISVTNLGMFGVEEFAAIINPPHAAILAVGAVRDEPVVEGGVVVPGKRMALTLSVDHRPVDGALAARWMAVLVELLEHPVRLLS